MSPEQAEMSHLDTDTRGDVYSLGVLLYELLVGSTPIRWETLNQVGYAEIQRMIVEDGTPHLITRLNAIGEELAIIARYRGVEPKQLQQSVRGELDWIALRALEKDRSRRYDSPGRWLRTSSAI